MKGEGPAQPHLEIDHRSPGNDATLPRRPRPPAHWSNICHDLFQTRGNHSTNTRPATLAECFKRPSVRLECMPRARVRCRTLQSPVLSLTPGHSQPVPSTIRTSRKGAARSPHGKPRLRRLGTLFSWGRTAASLRKPRSAPPQWWRAREPSSWLGPKWQPIPPPCKWGGRSSHAHPTSTPCIVGALARRAFPWGRAAASLSKPWSGPPPTPDGAEHPGMDGWDPCACGTAGAGRAHARGRG